MMNCPGLYEQYKLGQFTFGGGFTFGLTARAYRKKRYALDFIGISKQLHDGLQSGGFGGIGGPTQVGNGSAV